MGKTTILPPSGQLIKKTMKLSRHCFGTILATILLTTPANSENMVYRLANSIINNNYDPTIAPITNASEKLNVNITMQIQAILSQGKEQHLDVYGQLELRWWDEFLHWSPEDYDFLVDMYFSHEHIWTPHIQISHSASTPLMHQHLNAQAPSLQYDGNVTQIVYFQASVLCNLCSASHEKCAFSFAPKTASDFRMQVASELFGPDERACQLPNGFKLIGAFISSNNQSASETVDVSLEFTRSIEYLLFHRVLPCFLLSVFATMTLFLPIDHKNIRIYRCHVGLFALTAHYLFYWHTNDQNCTTQFTRFDYFNFALIAILLVENACAELCVLACHTPTPRVCRALQRVCKCACACVRRCCLPMVERLDPSTHTISISTILHYLYRHRTKFDSPSEEEEKELPVEDRKTRHRSRQRLIAPQTGTTTVSNSTTNHDRRVTHHERDKKEKSEKRNNLEQLSTLRNLLPMLFEHVKSNIEKEQRKADWLNFMANLERVLFCVFIFLKFMVLLALILWASV